MLANNTFAFELYTKLSSAQGNVIFSPYSISSALSMTAAGAKGETLRQMLATLHLPAQEEVHQSIKDLSNSLAEISVSKRIKLNTANSLWLQNGNPFTASFLELVQKYYDAELKNVDFKNASNEARIEINKWVEVKTQEKIKDLLKLGSVRSDTKLILVNAVYFLGSWLKPFEKNSVLEGNFYKIDSTPAKALFMGRVDEFKYGENDSYQILELPYEENRMVMNIVLPKGKDAAALEKAANQLAFDQNLTNLNSTKVAVRIPKFKIESSFDLPAVLGELGMVQAFDAKKADFSGISDNKEFFIGNVVHKAFVEVDEKGTEAAAATAVIMRAQGILKSNPIPLFHADHPFIFMIRDSKDGAILFMGRISEPKV